MQIQVRSQFDGLGAVGRDAEDVSMITGTPSSHGWRRTWRSTASPLCLGRFTSSTIKCGRQRVGGALCLPPASPGAT